MTTRESLFVDYDARLVRGIDEHAANLPGSWFITHPIGGPASGTYTEVAFTRDARFGSAFHEHPDRVLTEVARRVATELYGNAWAFIYEPRTYEKAIGRWDMRRRERVIVSGIEVSDAQAIEERS